MGCSTQVLVQLEQDVAPGPVVVDVDLQLRRPAAISSGFSVSAVISTPAAAEIASFTVDHPERLGQVDLVLGALGVVAPDQRSSRWPRVPRCG